MSVTRELWCCDCDVLWMGEFGSICWMCQRRAGDKPPKLIVRSYEDCTTPRYAHRSLR